MLGYYNYTVIPTYAGMLTAVFGIFLSIQGNSAAAVFCLMIAGFLDMFDGKIARTRKRTPEECRFGIQIDSLCDLISFGVLPAIIGWSVGMTDLLSMVILSLFILAALIRLAYFNVTEEMRQDEETGTRKTYSGLPVTSVALILPVLYALHTSLGELFPFVYAAALILIGLAFLTRFTISKPGLRGQIIMLLVGLTEILVLLWVRKRT